MTWLWAGLLAAAATGQQPVFRAVSEVVLLPVAVTADGRPVRDLAAGDFEVFDNGVRQQITAASLEALALDVTLVADLSGSIDEAARAAATMDIETISASLNADDRVRVIGFGERVADLSGWRPGGQPLTLRPVPGGAGTSLYDAMAAALLAPAGDGRPHLVVVFTDGRDTTSLLDRAAVDLMAGQILATVHVVLTRSPGPYLLGTTPWSGQPDVRQLRALTARTGGDVLELRSGDQRATAFRAILEAYRTMYLLRYTPTGVDPGGWHKIDVRVPGRRHQVRHRDGWGR